MASEKNKHKYPFVPKEYYPAVMFACKLIREHNQFNRAVRTAASYYNVDRDELEAHIRKRQAAGQKGQKRGTYFWYVCEYVVANEHYDYFEPEFARYEVVKATNEKNAQDQIARKYDRYGATGFDGTWAIFGDVIQFDAKQDAETKAKALTQEHRKKWGK